MYVLMRFKDDLKDLVQRLMDVDCTIRRSDRLLLTKSFENAFNELSGQGCRHQ